MILLLLVALHRQLYAAMEQRYAADLEAGQNAHRAEIEVANANGNTGQADLFDIVLFCPPSSLSPPSKAIVFCDNVSIAKLKFCEIMGGGTLARGIF